MFGYGDAPADNNRHIRSVYNGVNQQVPRIGGKISAPLNVFVVIYPGPVLHQI